MTKAQAFYQSERDYEEFCDDVYAEERRLAAQDANHEAYCADMEAKAAEAEWLAAGGEPVQADKMEIPF